MTKNWNLCLNLFKKKSASVHLVVGLQLIAVIISMLTLVVKQSFERTAPVGSALTYGFVAAFILFILLARRTERVWTSNLYRLLPTTDTRLYVANLLSTLLNFIYFIVLELVVLGLCSLFLPLNNISIPAGSYRYTATGLLVIVALALYGWVFISLVHLIGRTISTWLPEMRSKFIYFLLYVIVVFILVKLLSLASNLFNKLSVILIGGQLDANVLPGLLSFSGVMVLLIIIFSAINIYLLKHRVETKQTA
ncbi:ABC transporter permease [Loigolactobacillus binensis]|uniref:ABC transporter permease n=1 Tax=Loigolactobacillus binensis TaxID=2559922 RepID=A0ABW3EEQ1_9LACO|nr:ABC transporter permease [Loigolactobacillus binensis]